MPRKFALPAVDVVVKPSELQETEEDVAFAHARAYARSIESNEEYPLPDKMKWFMRGLWVFIVGIAFAFPVAVVLMSS